MVNITGIYRYTSPPTIVFTPSGATGTAIISGGQVIGIDITSNPPCYWGCPPTISFIGGGGNGATAICHLDGGAQSTNPQYNNFSKDLYVLMSGMEHPDQDYIYAQWLGHELGHNLDLIHTYGGNNGGTDCSNDEEYLSDIFGSSWPGNCPHPYDNTTWNADPWAVNGDGITNNMMGGNQNMRYISPQQAGQMHRTLYLKTTRKYVSEELYSTIPLVIDSNFPIPNPQNQLWDFDIKLYSDLIIESGSELTITCRVVMPYKGKIIVKPGGKLILDGGWITTDSKHHLWKGIEVWGNADLPQNDRNQGILVLLNRGRVENAEIGILCGKREGGSYDDNYSGGIIYTNSTDGVRPKILNNNIGIMFRPYTSYPSYSHLYQTDFLIDKKFLNQTFSSLIDAESINGITILGSNFTNSLSDNPNFVAINAVNTGILLDGFCTNTLVYPCPEADLIYNNFNNFDKGISCINTGVSFTVSVSRTNFTNNICGTYLSGYINPVIVRNTFNVPGNTSYLAYIPPYGIYLDCCTGYHVEGNEFYSVETSPYSIGIIINNSGTAANEIYRNTFTGLKYATDAIDINKHPSNGIGLCFVCNDFKSVSGEIMVTRNYTYNRMYGVAEQQVNSSGKSPMNLFYINSTSHIDFYNEGYDVWYKEPTNSIPLIPSGWTYYLPNASGNVHYSYEGDTKERSCPSHLDGLPDSKFLSNEGFVLPDYINFNAIKETDVDNLKNKMNSLDIKGAYARNALIASKKLVYQEPYKNPEELNLKSKEAKNTNELFTLYPNPAKESFTLTNNQLNRSLSINIFNSLGEKVYECKFDQQVQEFKPNLKGGVYIINIYEEGTMLKCFKLTIIK